MAGSAIGALFSGPLMAIGRWKCIMLTNLLVLSGSVLSVVPNIWCLSLGRFLFGMSAGAFTCFCPKYISEVSPVEVKGPAGALSQIFCTFGILIPFSIALAYPDVKLDDKDYSEDKNTTFIWIVFLLPVALSIVQLALMQFVFNYDTPLMLKQKGEYVKLNEFLTKIYHPTVVQERIDEINAGGVDNS